LVPLQREKRRGESLWAGLPAPRNPPHCNLTAGLEAPPTGINNAGRFSSNPH